MLAATNRVAEATIEYRRARDRDPLELGTWNNLAAALVKQGHVAGTRRELSRVLAIDPENALARTNLDIVRSLKPSLEVPLVLALPGATATSGVVFYWAEQGVGFQPLASGCFLNCDVLTQGCCR